MHTLFFVSALPANQNPIGDVLVYLSTLLIMLHYI